MLARLYISNFALIREMEVSFPGRLTMISGETGAGKSIFLEALALALGSRASIPESGDRKKCVVEAEFRVRRDDFAPLFEAHGLDADDVLLLRREISADGRSRALVNDAAVSLSVLKDFAAQLVDIHSQHQTLELGQGKFQLALVDAFAGNQQVMASYHDAFSRLNVLRKKLSGLEEQEMAARKEQDYLEFLSNELADARLAAGQAARLEAESARLTNTEAIRTALLSAAATLDGGEGGVLSQLTAVRQQLGAIAGFGETYAQLHARVQSAYIELKDISGEAHREGEGMDLDNERLDAVSAQLDRLGRLMKKHQVTNETQLLEVQAEIDAKLQSLTSLSEQIAVIKKEIATAEKSCMKLAADLSARRAKTLPGIEKKVSEMLGQLAMPNATFKIVLSRRDELSATGYDHVSFVFSANKGSELLEIQKAASGGELSRLMLCLKALLADKKNLPAIIFDEIDTGVSGEVAARIGAILHTMSAAMQVIAITHLPQMASRGDHHLFVYKEEAANNTISRIKTLTGDERILEIARMLSAGKPGKSALENARELLRA